jgi:hypothetical protein
MKKVRIVITHFCITFLFAHLEAQSGLDISISFPKDTLDFVSVWDIDLAIDNNSDRDIFSYPIINKGGNLIEYGELRLEILCENDSIWRNARSFTNIHLEGYSAPENYVVLLKPNDMMKNTFHCRPPFEILKFGALKARIAFRLFEVNDSEEFYAYSNVVDVYINEYVGIDRVAYNYLNSINRFDFLLSPLISLPASDSSDVTHAEYLVQNFPGVDLSVYANLYLSLFYAVKANNLVSKAKSKKDCLDSLKLSKELGLKARLTGNQAIRMRANEVLGSLSDILDVLYSYAPPVELEEEFTFPFKH